ncbi:MAG: hypothetical protein KKD18_05725 [Nanoarchaeota archaeon]|nr:hypothetical protein [Nanoarchaeota archaeon]MBU0977889.1 hypothetical protein [Nanoarchaeota archaeon]
MAEEPEATQPLSTNLIVLSQTEIRNEGQKFSYVDHRQPYAIECPGRTEAKLPNTKIWLVPTYSTAPTYSPDTRAIDRRDGTKSDPLPVQVGRITNAHPLNASWRCQRSNQEGPDCYTCIQNGGYFSPKPPERIAKTIKGAKKRHP